MKALAELSIALLELLEAEARALRRGLARVGLAGIFLLIGGGLGALGFALCFRGLHLYLCSLLSPAGAAVASGLLALTAAGVVLWIAAKIVK